MKLLVRLLILSLGISRAFAAISDGVNPSHATNVTIVNLEEGDGYVIVTFSEEFSEVPPCAAEHKNALVIGNGNGSPDALHARSAFSLGQALEVWGAGNCKRVAGYETLAGMQLVK